MKNPDSECSFPNLLQEFFCQELTAQRNASPRTIASYRDAFRLLLNFVQQHTGKAPTELTFTDLDAPRIVKFLDHLERTRHNTVRSRNVRLAALRSFMRYTALHAPMHLAVAQRVLAIPAKRWDRPALRFLSPEEIQGILKAPDRSTWNGHRDYVLLSTLYNTGARVSEIAGARVADLCLQPQPSLLLHGKGRKERTMPLWKSTAARLKEWLRRIDTTPSAALFPNRFGQPLTRSGVEYRLRLAVAAAGSSCPSLRERRVSPHTIRHTTAMHLLDAGVPLSVIALWLGHEGIQTTHGYVEADLQSKQRALQKLQPPSSKAVRYRPSDRLLAFLEGL